MTQEDCIFRNLNSQESVIVAKIVESTTIDQIQALASREIRRFLEQSPSTEANKRILEIFYKHREFLRFDEFKDKELADWKRVRSAIEHENALVNHRLTWLLSSQGFLFAGFGVVYASKNINELNLYGLAVLAVIAILGMATSFKIFQDIDVAASQLKELDRWWHETYGKHVYSHEQYKTHIERRNAAYNKELKKRHPALQGSLVRKMFWLDKGLKVEISFLIAWILIFSGVIAKPLIKKLIETKFDSWDVLVVLPILLILFFFMAWRRRYLSEAANS
jgi:hypothetical protein